MPNLISNAGIVAFACEAKSFHLPFSFHFSLFLFCRCFFDGSGEAFWVYFIICYAGWCEKDRTTIMGHTSNFFRQGYFY